MPGVEPVDNITELIMLPQFMDIAHSVSVDDLCAGSSVTWDDLYC